MPSTKLRLLLDESITKPLTANILDLTGSAVHAKAVGLGGKNDLQIVSFAKKHRRIIVAVDNDFKPSRYPLSSHFGVIKFSTTREDDGCLFAIFKSFWHSGYRKHARNAYTYLTTNGVKIQNDVDIKHAWQPKPCSSGGP